MEKDKDKTFSVTKQTGDVNLDKKLQPDMEGYYTFKVKVYDTDKTEIHSDEAKVSVYVISDASQVVFKFFNTVEEVQNGRIKVRLRNCVEDFMISLLKIVDSRNFVRSF